MSYVKKSENKYKLNIQELLKNSGVESMLDLNKLIGKTKKHFIESTLDAEFGEHMGYQEHDQNSKDISNNYRKGKTKKIIWTDNGRIDIQAPREQLSTFNQRLLKSMKEIYLELKIKYFFIFKWNVYKRHSGNNISNVLLWFRQRHNF